MLQLPVCGNNAAELCDMKVWDGYTRTLIPGDPEEECMANIKKTGTKKHR